MLSATHLKKVKKGKRKTTNRPLPGCPHPCYLRTDLVPGWRLPVPMLLSEPAGNWTSTRQLKGGASSQQFTGACKTRCSSAAASLYLFLFLYVFSFLETCCTLVFVLGLALLLLLFFTSSFSLYIFFFFSFFFFFLFLSLVLVTIFFARCSCSFLP